MSFFSTSNRLLSSHTRSTYILNSHRTTPWAHQQPPPQKTKKLLQGKGSPKVEVVVMILMLLGEAKAELQRFINGASEAVQAIDRNCAIALQQLLHLLRWWCWWAHGGVCWPVDREKRSSEEHDTLKWPFFASWEVWRAQSVWRLGQYSFILERIQY